MLPDIGQGAEALPMRQCCYGLFQRKLPNLAHGDKLHIQIWSQDVEWGGGAETAAVKHRLVKLLSKRHGKFGNDQPLLIRESIPAVIRVESAAANCFRLHEFGRIANSLVGSHAIH